MLFLFLMTFRGNPLIHYAASLVATFLYACSDEWRQYLAEDRGPKFTDVLIDLAGALICCTLLLLVYYLLRARKTKGRSHLA